jgi:small subunit ribosomal protein S3Ae
MHSVAATVATAATAATATFQGYRYASIVARLCKLPNKFNHFVHSHIVIPPTSLASNSIDPFLKKEWYKLVAPSIFAAKDCGKTIITKTQGTKIASDGLKGRVIELSLADLQNNESLSWRKVKLCIEDVQGYNCLLNFHGMDMTRDKVCSLIKKRQTIVEGNVDCRTTDGYIVRMFCIAFTKPQDNQIKNTCYAKATQVRAIRAKMVQVMSDLGTKGDLKSLVKELISAPIGEQIEREASGIFPIKDCYIRKVKVLKKPKFDVTALMEWHNDDSGADTGTAVKPEAENLVAGSGGRL